MPQFTRRQCLRAPRPFSILGQERQLLRWYSQGRVDRAYRLAVGWERHAVHRGDQLWAERMRTFSSAIGKVREQPPGTDTVSLEQAAARAASQEFWSQAVSYTQAIIRRGPANPGVRARALANRATGLHTTGYLDTAVQAYDELIEDQEAFDYLAPNYRVAFLVSREIVQWYRRMPINLQVVGDATLDLAQAPVTWMAYWWLLGHMTWQRTPQRVAGIRASSHRTFGLEWRLDYDRALWGLDLLAAGSGDDTGLFERRVRLALKDPVTVELLGRSAWIDLNMDWLTFLAGRRPAEAVTEGATFVAWCQEFGYHGWAAYWQRTASILA